MQEPEVPLRQPKFNQTKLAIKAENKSPRILKSPLKKSHTASVLLDENRYNQIAERCNYSYWELSNYEDSLNFYGSEHIQRYLLSDKSHLSRTTEEEDKEELSKTVRLYRFKKFTVENLIKECITVPIRQIFSKVCTRFVHRLNVQCKL